MSLFQRKSYAAILEIAKKSPLAKTLGVQQLVILGVSCIIGAGIFVMTGEAAANYAGPALIFSYIICGIACLLAGLCYAEFAAMVPISGSAYTYSYVAFGEIIAWTVGWCLCLEYLVASSTVAVAWSTYVTEFFKNYLDMPLSSLWTNAPLKYEAGKIVTTGAIFNLPAALIVTVISFLLIVGIKQSTRFSFWMVLLKVSVIVAFILIGVHYVDPANYSPFIPEAIAQHPVTKTAAYGVNGVFTAASIIFFAYIGFDAVSTAAQETKNPQRDLPKGMLYSLLICTSLYILMTLVLTGIVNYKDLGTAAPVAEASKAFSIPGSGLTISLGAIVGLTSVILVLLLGQSRIFMAMANDGLLPQVFKKVHNKYKTPYISNIICFLVAAPAAGFLPLGILGDLVNLGTLIAFVVVCLGVLVLRRKNPEWQRPFKVPYIWLIAPLGALACLGLIANLPKQTFINFGIWMLIGFAVYFGYSYRHSVLRNR